MSYEQWNARACRRPAGGNWNRGWVRLAAAAVVLAGLSAAPAVAQSHHEMASAVGASPAVVSEQMVLGDVVPFGEGTARSWVSLDAAGKPTAVGITLTEAALDGLPADATPGLVWMVEYVLGLPPDVSGLPFDHIGVNWNPQGHIPNGIYNVPHFDFHFYTISPEERRQITARGDDLERCRAVPAAGEVPEGFIFAPESEEPGMGGHWVDPQSHEFHGQDFTSTFIYGTHDGKVIFWEPMVTMAFLETKPEVTVPLKVPGAYASEGYYPTSYDVRYDAKRKEYTVALGGMMLRQTVAAR